MTGQNLSSDRRPRLRPVLRIHRHRQHPNSRPQRSKVWSKGTTSTWQVGGLACHVRTRYPVCRRLRRRSPRPAGREPLVVAGEEQRHGWVVGVGVTGRCVAHVGLIAVSRRSRASGLGCRWCPAMPSHGVRRRCPGSTFRWAGARDRGRCDGCWDTRADCRCSRRSHPREAKVPCVGPGLSVPF